MKAYLMRARRSFEGCYGPDGKPFVGEYVVDEHTVRHVIGAGTFDPVTGRLDLGPWIKGLTVRRERNLAVVRALFAGLPQTIVELPDSLDDDQAKRKALELWWGTRSDGTGGCNGNVFAVIEEEE